MLYRLYKEPDEERNWYYESDNQGIVYRQIVKQSGRKPKLSNQRESQFHLAEGEIELEDSTLITLQKKDFEKEWTTSNAEYMIDWEVVKKDNKVGKEVTGMIEVIFPQGVIVTLHHLKYPGIVSYEKLVQSVQAKNIYPHVQIVANIIGYDESNGWIKLNHARLL